MAEGFGPDEELRARRAAYDAAVKRLDAAKEQYGQAEGFRGTQAGGRVEGELRAAEDAVRSAAEHYNRGLEQHPANQYRQILEEAESITAPELSSWQWFKQNPGMLEAVPKSDDERAQAARAQFILQRVQSALGRDAGGPFSWATYSGPGADAIRADSEAARAYAASPSMRQAMASPYHYQPYTLLDERGEMLPLMEDSVYPKQYGEELTGSPLVDRVLGNAYRPLAALWGGTGRFHDNFASGGAALSEGRLGDAAKSFAYAVPNLISPAFHRGGPGMQDDWRGYVGERAASAMDSAATLPFWFTRGLYASRPGGGVSVLGSENRIRQYRDELLGPLLKQAARRHHPDVGGSVEAMKRANAAFDAGDVETLRQMAQ